MSKSRLDHTFQLASDDAGDGCHLKARLAKFPVGQGLPKGANNQKYSDDGKNESDISDRLLSRLLRKDEQHWHRDQVPEHGEDPRADHVGAGLADDSSLRPVFAPQPGLGRVLSLFPLLALGEMGAVKRSENQAESDAAKYEAEDKQHPGLRLKGAV